MKAIPLITSLPLALARRTPDGREVGEQYQARCIESWRACGFEPLTVNSRRELGGLAEVRPGVRQVVVDADASDEAGNPLVYLRDVLSVAARAAGPVAVTNADILLDTSSPLRELARDLAPGHLFFAKRVDVLDPDHRTGSEFTHGFDFFLGHSRDLAACADSRLIFGEPWWDHYLPLRLYLQGATLHPSRERRVFHLAHPDRWNPDRWRLAGERFLTEIGTVLRGTDIGRESPARRYEARLQRAISEPEVGLLMEMRWRFRDLIGKGWGRRAQSLSGVAELNLAVLDETFTQDT